MMLLVIGGSGSGKSAYAEKMACRLSNKTNIKKYYLATMRIFDDETQKKADRHRALRRNKGFTTIEQPVDISKAVEKMETKKAVALLECITNLTANEMFAEETMLSVKQAVEKITVEVEQLRKELTHLVIVSGNVFEDGILYDSATANYIEAMGRINQTLAVMADEVVEVVVGIPLVQKRREQRCMS